MDSAKEIAREMLEAINVDGSGFFGAVAKGFISLPVSLGYLGYDFIDTEHRQENLDDKFRIAKFIKRTYFNRELVEKVINVFIDDFVSRIDMQYLGGQMVGSGIGKMFFAQWTGVQLGYVISERAVTALFAGTIMGSLLSIGAETSRAIYTSRYLRERSSGVYYKLRNMGDLDLIYFLVEDTVKPFEIACHISESDPAEFNRVCKYFLAGL